MIEIPARPKILVVALRRIGDVLLTTPLVRSLRRAWPDAQLDVLVFADTAGILDGNPDVNNVIVMPSGVGDALALAARMARKYDLAISTQSGDRPVLFAWIAGRKSVAPVGGENLMSKSKRLLLTKSISAMAGAHRVEEMLQLADAVGVKRIAQVVCPTAINSTESVPAGSYAMLHPAPMFQYKRWTDNGWREVIDGLSRRGLQVVVTGGPASNEQEYLDRLLEGMTYVRRVDGKLTWPELAALAKCAVVYVGPDTSVTHLAAAAGTPTVALYGPTDPRLWGPWPADGLSQPWDATGTTQRRGNVWLVQNPQPCQPCQQEGCDHHIMSHSRCLDELPARQVLNVIDQALSSNATRSGARA